MRGALVRATTCLALAAPAAAQMPPATKPIVVKTASGEVAGDDRGDVHVFQGIPFAAPPIGALRWAPPQPVAPWPGVRSAIAAEPSCVQPVDPDYAKANFGGVQGAQSEDCLYLQVHAPPRPGKAPVVVWFHGGAFFLGAGSLGSYDGTANARQGVMTVSVNYRLGALGGLAHPALKASTAGRPAGNYALLDAIAALQWVRANAAAFGGDPGNVTIAGQSAGGGVVTGLLSMPLAKGLFHKAVIQSGALLYPDRDPEKAAALAVDALKPAGIGADVKLSELRAISAQTFAAHDPLRRGWFFIKDPVAKPLAYVEALESGREIDVPVLVGANSGEPGFAAARKIAQLSGATGAASFLYQFDYTPAFRNTEWPKGPIHSAELMFTFDSIDRSSWGGAKADAADRAMAGIINGCWTAFYKMAPSARSFACPGGYVWKAYDTARTTTRFGAGGPLAVDGGPLSDGPPRQTP
jgi:para-nitrobenzyl esterase